MKIASNGVEIEIGPNGATFIPSVSENGDLSWTNDSGLDNPETVNIKGPKGDKGDKGDGVIYTAGSGISIAGTVISAVAPTLTEYDATNGWHIRKFSDGYIEMIHTQSITVSQDDWNESGNLFAISNAFKSYGFPVVLTKLYSMTFSVTNLGHGYGGFVTQDSSVSDQNKTLPWFALWRATKPSAGDKTYTLNVNITGRWTDSASTYKAPSIDASFIASDMVENITSTASSAKESLV